MNATWEGQIRISIIKKNITTFRATGVKLKRALKGAATSAGFTEHFLLPRTIEPGKHSN